METVTRVRLASLVVSIALATFSQGQEANRPIGNTGVSTFTLTVTTQGSGFYIVISNPAGINCGIDCSEAYEVGTMVTLNVGLGAGTTFEGWSGHADCSDGVVTMTANIGCTATFSSDMYPLTVTKAGNGTGTVTSAPPGINCGVDCTEDYAFLTMVTLTPTADTGSTFTGWAGDADCADGSVTIGLGPVSCQATFTLQTFPLTVSTTGSGTGTVTSSPAGINCGADCSETYNYNTPVTLTPTPAAGSRFSAWSGDADCTDGVVTMTAARTCTATFILQPTLTVSLAGNGSGTVASSPPGINCGADCSEAYDLNTIVTLTPTPATGSNFSGWTGDADCADGVVAMSAARTCTATFTLQTFVFTVTRAGDGSGRVTSSPAGIDCGLDCTEPFAFGTVVTLTPTPDAGSVFAGWTGDADCTDGIITIDSTSTCTATFAASIAIPTLSEWAMLFMTLSLLVVGLRRFA